MGGVLGDYLAKFTISFFPLSLTSSFFGGHIRKLIPYYSFMGWDPMEFWIDSFLT